MDGQTATNPQTGERVILRGGQWVPMGGPTRPASDPVTAQPRRSSQPRGIRNNNPGNIEDGPFARSLPGYAGSDGRFARFDNPDAGQQASVRLLESYHGRGINTPLSIINRWAPPSDNNPTQDYAAYVAQRVGVGMNDPITPDKLPLVAQAINEFENGQRVNTAEQVSATAEGPQIATNPQTGEQVQLVDGAWVPLTGEFETAMPGAAVAQDGTSQDRAIDLSVLYEDTVPLLKQGAWVRNGEEVYQLPGDAFTDRPRATDETLGGNAFLRRPNAQDAIGAFATAASEQIPFLDESVALTTGAITGQGYEGAREAQALNRDLLNQTDHGARNAGGIAGFGAGLLAPGGAFIGRGANTAERMSRAALVGSGYGTVYGAGNTEGDLQDRAGNAALGAATGFATGGIAQGAIDRLARQVGPSAARVLSRENVDLTPGQMFGQTPVIGPVIRGLEEGASSIPVVGAPISAARDRSIQTFNRAAINRALFPIGKALPKDAQMGTGAVEFAQRALGEAYDEVLPRINAQLDQGLYDDIAEIMNTAATEMPEDLLRQYATVLQNRVFRNVDQTDATMTGEQLKRIESELGAISRNYRTAADPAARSLGTAVEETRAAIRSMIGRQNPEEAARLQSINQGYSNLVRVEDAAGSTASQAAEGVFSPAQLGMAANRGASRSTRARGQAPMQDLAMAGRAVIPSRVGDSGTATRGTVTGMLAGGVGLINPHVAVPAAVGLAAVYSRPVQAIMNKIYRATDARGRFSALGELRQMVLRNPALQPVYQDAVRLLRPEAQNQSPSMSPAGEGQPLPIGP